jgi:hypothetical protein
MPLKGGEDGTTLNKLGLSYVQEKGYQIENMA